MSDEEKILACIEQIYPGESKRILSELDFKDLKEQHSSVSYTDLQIYITYANSFPNQLSEGDFGTLAEQVSRIKDIGFNTMHILPFLESPRIDEGFDVSNYFRVDALYGGEEEFKRFLAEAKKHGMVLIMDFVLNHVSEKHDWFIRAQKGEEKYRDFFVFRKSKPQVIKKEESTKGILVTYNFNRGSQGIKVVFPDQMGEVPHFRQGYDGFWYFHTFYPQQIDLNWKNPDVFIEMAKILIYWARRGFSFRLDAVTHIGKELEKGVNSKGDSVRSIMLALKKILSVINPCSVFLPEVAGFKKDVSIYFGKNEVLSDLCYDFECTGNIWASLLLEDKKFIVNDLESKAQIPGWGQWVYFLRNHDELIINRLPKGVQKKLLNALEGKTERYRAGTKLTGRVASMLDGDEKRTVLAHLLLASLPYIPQVVYGDEVGKLNDYEYMKKRVDEKRALTSLEVRPDVRDINRGIVTRNDLEKGAKIQAEIANIFRVRADWHFSRKWPRVIFQQDKRLLMLRYELPGKQLSIYINLSSDSLPLDSEGKIVLSVNGGCGEQLPAYSGIWVVE